MNMDFIASVSREMIKRGGGSPGKGEWGELYQF
jgi:hypothetical protein